MQREREEYEQKLAAQRAALEAEKKAAETFKNEPHLKNINSDPQMSGTIKKALKPNTSVGKVTKDCEPDIKISGVGIGSPHCILQYNSEERVATVMPNEEDSEKYPVKINGELVTEPRPLVHGDRLLVGMHHYYLYCDPVIDVEAMVPWEDAMKEANADALNNVQTDNAELEKIKAEAEALRKEQEENEARMKEQMAKIEEERAKQEEELAKRRAEMLEQAEGEAKKQLEE